MTKRFVSSTLLQTVIKVKESQIRYYKYISLTVEVVTYKHALVKLLQVVSESQVIAIRLCDSQILVLLYLLCDSGFSCGS